MIDVETENRIQETHQQIEAANTVLDEAKANRLRIISPLHAELSELLAKRNKADSMRRAAHFNN